MDRLHKSLAKYAELILRTKTASGKGKLDGLKVKISGPQTDSEKNAS